MRLSLPIEVRLALELKRVEVPPRSTLAWCFLPAGATFRGEPIQPGVRYEVPLVDERHWQMNYNAFDTVDEAIFWAHGPIVVRSRIYRPRRGDNKCWRGTAWKTLWMQDVSRELRAFSIWAAQQGATLMSLESLNALTTAERYHGGATTAEDLDEAYQEAMAQVFHAKHGAEWLAAACCVSEPHLAAFRTLAAACEWPTLEVRQAELNRRIEALAPPPEPWWKRWI